MCTFLWLTKQLTAGCASAFYVALVPFKVAQLPISPVSSSHAPRPAIVHATAVFESSATLVAAAVPSRWLTTHFPALIVPAALHVHYYFYRAFGDIACQSVVFDWLEYAVAIHIEWEMH